jgi:hypothetical protein
MSKDLVSPTSPSEPTRPPRSVAEAEVSLRPTPPEDVNQMTLRYLILELASLEDAQRVHRSSRPSHDPAAWSSEVTRLKARQRLVLRELRHRAHHRARLRPARRESSTIPGPPLLVTQIDPPASSTPLEPTG